MTTKKEPQRRGSMAVIDKEDPIEASEPEVEVIDDLIEDSELDEADEEVEDLEPDEELWPGGPTGADIEGWKARYGDVYVTSFTMDNHVVWRTLNRLEYKILVKKLEDAIAKGTASAAEANLINEEAICELCLLFPKMDRFNTDGYPAGMASIVAQQVMEASAFVAVEVRQL